MSQIPNGPSPRPSGLSTDGEAERSERPTGQFVIIAVLLVLVVEMVGLTYTMVTPALSEIAATYRTTHVAWLVTAVTLVGGVSFAFFGKLGDVLGKKRVVLGCSAVFILGSVVSALAPSFGVLIAGRAMQGVGITTLALVYGLVRDILPRRVVPVVLGVMGTGMGASMVIGPFIGGYLIDELSFRGVFWFQAVYLLIVGSLVFLVVPETPLRKNSVSLDWKGALLLGTGALALLLGIGGQSSSGSWSTVAGIAVGVVLLGAWLVYEHRLAEPLIDLGLLKQRKVSATMVGSFVVQFVLATDAMLLPLLVMTPASAGYGFGATALEVAKFMAAGGVAAMVAGLVAGALARRTGAAVPMGVGAIAMTAGSASLALFHDTETQVMLAKVVFGIGLGACSASLPNLIVESVPATEQGVSGGMLNLVGSLGSSIGSQVILVILFIPAAHYAGNRVIFGESGFTLAFLLLAGVAFVGLLAAVTAGMTRRSASGAVESAAV